MISQTWYCSLVTDLTTCIFFFLSIRISYSSSTIEWWQKTSFKSSSSSSTAFDLTIKSYNQTAARIKSKKVIQHYTTTKPHGDKKRDFDTQTLDLPTTWLLYPDCFKRVLFLCPLGFGTTTVAIYYYKKHILRSLNPRLLFMYWRRSVKGVAVAKSSAAALSKVSISNGHCTSS